MDTDDTPHPPPGDPSYAITRSPTIIRMTLPNRSTNHGPPAEPGEPDPGTPLAANYAEAPVGPATTTHPANTNPMPEATPPAISGMSAPVSPPATQQTITSPPPAIPAAPHSGPPTPAPMQPSAPQAAAASQVATFLSPTSSTTSFLANQYQMNNPQPTGTAPAGHNPQQQQSLQSTVSSHSGSVSSVSSAGSSGSQQSGHRMALNDAFSYLDRVKAEFAHQPEVYNKFLQVMREFKANIIDANGVIGRVVQLFRGHRDLILGFNAFLPKTHHIDPTMAETGELPTTLLSSGMIGAGSVPHGHSPAYPPPPTGQYPPMAVNQPGMPGGMYASIAPQQHPSGPQRHVPVPSTMAGHPPGWTGYQQMVVGQATTAPPPPLLGRPPSQGPKMMPPPPPPQQQQPPPIGPTMTPLPAPSDGQAAAGPGSALRRSSNAQFTRAIAYVKKVKQRFANDPDSYKTFLAALHSFHKDQRTVADVCAQVARLFKDHPDLMDEFLHFLPDSQGSTGSETGVVTMEQSRSRLPPMGQFSPTPAEQAAAAQQPQTLPERPSARRSAKRNRPGATGGHPAPLIPPPGSHQQPAITRTAEEAEFFERVKRHLGSRAVYAEFLKCLNMYSQNILRLSELIQLMEGFIGGDNDLFGWFKRYIGYSAGEEPRPLPPSPVAPEINLNACKRVGSYRLLPKSYKLPQSSCRTDLCLEVLNDTMISCPSFESEDSTFVSSRKNIFEEALFRCEDERFEMDLLIDGNRATIAVLEPIAKAFAVDSNAFTQLNTKLNGSSGMIYRKTLRRVYGEKAGDEAYEGMMRSPVVTVPIVLKRLKQKDEEWQRLRREWQRVWRQIHVRNYYRALDHQGIDFKQTDRRNTSTKALLQELEQLREERLMAAKRKGQPNNNDPLIIISLPPTASVCYEHAFRLLCKALAHSGSISSADRKPVRLLLGRILPRVFSFSIADKGTGKKMAEEASVSSEGEDEDSMSDVGSTAPGNRPFFVCYCNNALFAVIRMFATVVERLATMQRLSGELAGKPFFSDKVNLVARSLDLVNLSDGEEQQSENTSMTKNADFYELLISRLADLVSGNLEQAQFEEQVRYMFGLHAYPVFTIDRLFHSILRQAHSLQPQVTGGSASNGQTDQRQGEQLVKLLEDSARLPEYTIRISAEALLGQRDRLIRTLFVPESGRLEIFLVDTATTADSMAATPEERWSAYVDSFIRLDVNPIYANPSGKDVFLKRTLAKKDVVEPTVQYNLECKICLNTYKLFYVEDTEDFVYRRHDHEPAREGSRRGERFARWLEQFRLHS